MKKTLIKIFLIVALLFSFWTLNTNAWNTDRNYKNLDAWNINAEAESVLWPDNLKHSPVTWSKVIENNDLFHQLEKPDPVTNDKFFTANTTWEVWMNNFILNIAKDIKNIFLAITWIYFLIIVLRQLMTENAEEEFEKFKKWIRWITAWIILMQISYSFVETIFNKDINWKLAWSLVHNIIQPMVSLLEYAASFFFIAIAIFSYYRIITSSWDEEKAKKWKMSIVYAIIWFIVIQISKYLVWGVYSKTLCANKWIENCHASEIQETSWVLFDIINWTNGFVWIAVVIMIIYAWFQIIFSNWEDEKIKKAKKSLLYIIIWIIILMTNFIILTFFSTDKII